MKKLLTLLVAFSCVSAVFAYNGKHEADNRKKGSVNGECCDHKKDKHKPQRAVNMTRGNGRFERDSRLAHEQRRAQQERINREYDRRVALAATNKRMSSRERKKEIARLEEDRNLQLRNVDSNVFGGSRSPFAGARF